MAEQKIPIDILSDVVCPWCVIGYKRLSTAIHDLGLENDVVIRWHPFELTPHMPASGENLRQHLANKYGTTLNGSIEARKRLAALGEEVGFKFNYFDEMKMFNTRKAHILLRWGAEQGKQTELAEAIFSAYFLNREDISSTEVLLNSVKSIGLGPEAAHDVLQNSDYEEEIIDTERRWLSRGFQGVPVIIFGDKKILAGAQEISTYINALKAFTLGEKI